MPMSVIVLLAVLVLGGGIYVYNTSIGNPAKPPVSDQPILGGDRDEYGCIGSARYSWCEAKQKCLRVWEEACDMPAEGEKTGAGSCVVTGCSGQICSDEAVITTCEYVPIYSCYRGAKCERQADGKCGWTENPILLQCLKNGGRTEEAI